MTIRMAARMMGAEQKGRGAATGTVAAIATAAAGGGASGCTELHSDTLMNTPSAISDSGICMSENCAKHPTP